MSGYFSSEKSPVVYALLIINVLVYGGMVLFFQTPRFSSLMLYSVGAGWSGQPLSDESWRLLTSAFIHITPMHLVSNMLTLCAWGKRTEYRFGAFPFLAAYGASAVFSSVCSQIWLDNTVYAGASGAISGVLGLMIALALAGDPTIKGSEIVSNIVLNAALAYFYPVNWIAHLSGLVFGVLVGLFLLFCQSPLPWKRALSPFTSFASDGEQDNNFAPAPVSAEGAVITDTLYERLVKLAELRDKGILTEEEFAQQKARLLHR